MRLSNHLTASALATFTGALLATTSVVLAQQTQTNTAPLDVRTGRTAGMSAVSTGIDFRELINESTITVMGDTSIGMLVGTTGASSTGDVFIVNRGSILTGAFDAADGSPDYVNQHGIFVGTNPWSLPAPERLGSVSIINSGDIVTLNASSVGIMAARGASTGIIVVDSRLGEIVTHGGEADNGALTSDGIFVESGDHAVILAGNITALGNGYAINATAENILEIITEANTAVSSQEAATSAILATSQTGFIDVTANGRVLTSGRNAHGIEASSFLTPGRVNVLLETTGAIQTSGAGGIGIAASSGANSTVDVRGSVDARGERGAGVLLLGPGDASVTVGENAIITGGWQSDVNSIQSSQLSPQAAGVIIAGRSGTIDTAGAISALSDRAIASSKIAGDIGVPEGVVSVLNSGTITGFIDLSANAAHSISNTGVVASRHFADTNGDGTRDTRRVAVHNLGNSGSSFSNSGQLRLGASDGAAGFDDTGYVAPSVNGQALDASIYDFSREGLLQTQFLNTGTFTNQSNAPVGDGTGSGAIDLRGSAVGNTLLITSSANAQTIGQGTYIAAGGTIFLNAVLNQGLAPGGNTGSEADVLIVDRVALGAAPTRLDVTNRDGAGAFTPGNGILLVNVRDAAFSQAGAFVLNGDYIHQNETAIVGGAYAYKLRQGGVDGGDGNWYLRSTLVEEEGDVAPPLYQPGAPVYEALPGQLLALNALPTLQQRIGAVPFGSNGASLDIADHHAWLRVSGTRGAFTADSSTTSAAGDFSQSEIEVGAETGVYDAGEGTWFAGVNLRYGSRHTNVTSPHGDGSINTSFLGLGATATWYHDNGFYIDNQARVTWSWSDLSSATANRQLAENVSGFGLGLSSEIGQKLALFEDQRWTLTPQAQLSYSTADFTGFTDSFGASVGGGRNDDLTLRLGLSLDYQDSWTDEKGRQYEGHAYGIANLKIGLLPENSVELSGVTLSQSAHRVVGEVGVGATLKIDDRIHIFGEATVGTALNSFGDNIYGAAKVGFRVAF